MPGYRLWPVQMQGWSPLLELAQGLDRVGAVEVHEHGARAAADHGHHAGRAGPRPVPGVDVPEVDPIAERAGDPGQAAAGAVPGPVRGPQLVAAGGLPGGSALDLVDDGGVGEL